MSERMMSQSAALLASHCGGWFTVFPVFHIFSERERCRSSSPSAPLTSVRRPMPSSWQACLKVTSSGAGGAVSGLTNVVSRRTLIDQKWFDNWRWLTVFCRLFADLVLFLPLPSFASCVIHADSVSSSLFQAVFFPPRISFFRVHSRFYFALFIRLSISACPLCLQQ